jgi:hypothetical protein
MITRQLGLADGYVYVQRDDGSRTPLLCPYGQGAGILCCDSCAAFGIASGLADGGRAVTRVYCSAMPLGGVQLGALDG